MSDLAVLVPVLRRPHRVEPLLASLHANTPGEPHTLFIADADDEAERKAVVEAAGRWPNVRLVRPGGNYASKINLGVRETSQPLLLFGADDLRFHPDWLRYALAEMDKPGVAVVATNDLCNRLTMKGKLATHPLVTREYCKLGTIDDPTRVLHEAYPHEYVDREFSETAMHRNAFAYARRSVVEHLHPLVGKAPMDELYRPSKARMYIGRKIYWKRLHLWKPQS
jgi:glycosyltransferase involved in cell wall biosynthesis